MYNSFIQKITEGRLGKFHGIPGGLPRFDKRVYNIQTKKIISLVGSPKAGKSAFMLWRYIFIPWISGIRNIKWILYSLEMPVDEVKSRLASMFVHHYYGIIIDPNLIYSYGENILTDDQFEKIKDIDERFLQELFKNVIFIEDAAASNPTGIYRAAQNYARSNGTEIKEKYFTINDREEPIEKDRVIGYTPNNPKENVFIIVDTLGLMKKEQNLSKKDNIDRWMEYCTNLKKIYGYTIINLHHLNRQVGSIERRRHFKDELKPELEDIKDTSSLGEFSDMVIAIFNPNVYTNLNEHGGYDIVKLKGYYRSIHVIASRFTEFPINVGVIFSYATGQWAELPPASEEGALQTIYEII
ncbi:MAG: hypothetical protein KBG30_14455 [Bacteroidales bacterium]|nr:hypothetical protein [Bacteroidales bacterium]